MTKSQALRNIIKLRNEVPDSVLDYIRDIINGTQSTEEVRLYLYLPIELAVAESLIFPGCRFEFTSTANALESGVVTFLLK